jgi:hypothetical protein
MLSINTVAINTALASLYCINKFTREGEGEMIMVFQLQVLCEFENCFSKMLNAVQQYHCQ